MTLRLARSSVETSLVQSDTPPSEAKRGAWLSLLPAAAAVLVLFAWLPALGAPYQFDDYNTPVGDAASQSLSNWWHLLPHTLRPLTKLTYALESSLGLSGAPGRRLLNALLLSGSVWLLQSLLHTVAKLPVALALLVASVWAVHPVQAELVVALAGRPALLSLFLTLASALLLVRERPWAALGVALLALLARESALAWVMACAGLAAEQRGVSVKRIVAAVVVAFAAAALALASSSGVRGLVESALTAGGAWNRLGLQWAALTRGTFLLFAEPAAFTPDMEFAPSGLPRLGLILTSVALYAVMGFLVVARPRLRLFALLWLCFVLPLHSVVPKLDVLTARPFAASLAPLLGLAALAAAPWLAARRGQARATVGLALLFAALFVLTRQRAALYTDPIALWRDAAERTVHKVRPLVNLGTLLARHGQLAAAEATLLRARDRDPTNTDVRLRLRLVRRASLLPTSSTENPSSFPHE